MVDQLWLRLWVIERDNVDGEDPHAVSSRVLTAFPDTSYERSESPGDPPGLYDAADVLETAMHRFENRKVEEIGGHLPGNRAATLASCVLSSAVLGTLSLDKEDSIKFLALFREAIGSATDKYDGFFRKFKESLARKPGQEDDDSDTKTSFDSTKADQIQLGIRIEDIIDELYMLKQLFDTQASVLRRGQEAIEEPRCLKPLHQTVRDTVHRISTEYLPQTERSISDAERLRKNLYNLLDLQQREENVRESRAANQQALFTAKQALSSHDQAAAAEAQSLILFLFTIVTIVFLPLSFFTSFFGMYDVNKSDGKKMGYSNSYVKTVIWSFGGTFYSLALLAAAALYRFRTKISEKEWIRWLNDLKGKRSLPRFLIEKGGTLDRKMEELAKMDAKNKFDRHWEAIGSGAEVVKAQEVTARSSTSSARRRISQRSAPVDNEQGRNT